MIDRAYTPKIVPFHQRKLGRGTSVFRTEVGVKRRAELMLKTPGLLARKKESSVLGQQPAWRDVLIY